jgi:hypothetical protein
VAEGEEAASSQLRQMVRLLAEYSIHFSNNTAELRLRFFILSISCARLNSSKVWIKGCNLQLPTELVKG